MTGTHLYMPSVKPWVTFDLDHTLVMSPYWRLHLFPWLALQADRQRVDRTRLRRTLYEVSEQLWRQGRWVDSFDWAAIAREMELEPLPDPAPPDLAALRPLVLAGVDQMLVALKGLDVHLGLVTNGLSSCQTPYVKALGWDYFFDAVVTPDRAGVAKPHPGIMAGLEPGLAHIGDRLSHDVLVARRTNRKAVLLGAVVPETDHIDPLAPASLTADYYAPDIHAIVPIVRHLLSLRDICLA